MDRKRFITRFRIDQLPTWPCPSCDTGTLSTRIERIKDWETVASKQYHEQSDWEPEAYQGNFMALLTCNNNSCKEQVIMVGESGEEYVRNYNTEKGYYDESLIRDLKPLHFLPPIKLFRPHERTPAPIREAVESAFALVWCDPPSAANKIRVVVEMLMDCHKVKKYSRTKNPKTGKRNTFTLHARIKLFKETRPIEAERLEACKWIGNAGSHAESKLSLKQTLDGFEILEDVLDKLFNDHPKRLDVMVKSVNKRKKPIT